MASEMVERVARAIEEAAKVCNGPATYYNAVAIAAIEAMRDPAKDIEARLREFGFAFVEAGRIESFGERVKARSDLATEYAAMFAAEIEAAKQP